MDCPGCDSPVTLEVGPERPLSTSLPDAVLAAEEDETAVERAALVDEITDELAAIDSLATLEDALAEIRRQRRLEPSTTVTDEDTRRK